MVKKEKGELFSTNYYRGIIHGLLNTEAIRKTQEEYGQKPLTGEQIHSGEQIHWGLEHLHLTEESLGKLGAKGLLPPIQTSCARHTTRGKTVIFQQWSAKTWKPISEWIEPDYELTDKLVKKRAKKYAVEKGIELRDCAREE